MTVGSLRDLVWYLALAFGWLGAILLGSGWYARRRFHALLKAPLTDEVEHLTHVWEKRVTRWAPLGMYMAGVSILCTVFWMIVGAIP